MCILYVCLGEAYHFLLPSHISNYNVLFFGLGFLAFICDEILEGTGQ